MSDTVRRAIIYTHRWLGIAGCVLFIAWFVSGIVMMYARMPELTPADRLARAERLDLSSARIGAADAARAAGFTPETIRLAMFGGRPLFRLAAGRRAAAVFADTGERLPPLDTGQALAAAARFAPEHASTLAYREYLAAPDQWTLTGPARGMFPLHRIALGDAAGTDLYIAAATGEPATTTDRAGRWWGFAGAVIHWIYFTPLRRQAAFWTQLIIWTSIAGGVMCLSGLVWGAWRLSTDARYRLKRQRSHTPYAGMMRWHHYAGLIFGATTFTWIFSGLLSMDPWGWSPGTSATPRQREAVAGGPIALERITADRLRAASAALRASVDVRELEVLQFGGEPFGSVAGTHSLVSLVAPERGAFARFDEATIQRAARAAMPETPIAEASWLDRYDPYYYRRDGMLPLPVYRVKFADAQATWLYLDPYRGAIARKEERLSRVNRWLYHGLHSLDFPFLYYRRPLWDVVVILLSLGGIVSSVTPLAAVGRRLRRHWRRLIRPQPEFRQSPRHSPSS